MNKPMGGRDKFFYEIARASDFKEEDLRDLWEIIVDYIVNKLRVQDDLVLPYIGKIRLTKINNGKMHVPISNDPKDAGKTKIIEVEEFYKIYFRFSEMFKEQVNNRALTRVQRNIIRQKAKEEALIQENKDEQYKYVLKSRENLDNLRKKRTEKIKQAKRGNTIKEIDPSDYGEE